MPEYQELYDAMPELANTMMMLANHQELYAALMKLTETHEAFLASDQTRDGHLFRIFSYRVPSYTDFCEPHALDTRGTMFELHPTTKEPLWLAALPFEKFFGLNENPMTTGLDLSRTKYVYTKEDGSLISTYMVGNNLYLKSKASLWSEQAMDAEKFLQAPEQETFYKILWHLTVNGYTVNMEWVSPANRVVLGYAQPALVVLSVRNRRTGEYRRPHQVPNTSVGAWMDRLEPWWVKDAYTGSGMDVRTFVESIPAMEGIEGFVVVLDDETKIKVKTTWYLTRHRMKDSVYHPRHLFEAVIREATDDLKMLFAADPATLALINAAEQEFLPKYNHMIAVVEKFHADNQSLSRKDYAIKAQALDDGLMPLYMNAYLGRQNDFQTYAVKYSERFGVKPVVPYQATNREQE